ncbi:M16 family metallopeptidase [Kriegella aquimaris]|uniref:Predicted Zn-dependent peptidase n=1 Tax=Kriegella aquimaris TaxID=192904 RepID=A0A1G9M2F0_9FLAO|nr:pitrilysin family protein [Kriegella aquimaris]SDL68324.1 Predicted Zn-dependent peptidase [Kriegella aquimaris]
MKKHIALSLTILFFGLSLHAQIDRSHAPKPGPAPEINLKDPQRFEMKNGLKVMVVEDHKLPKVSVQLLIDNPPILEGQKAGVSSLTASLLGKGSTSISMDDFNEEVDYLGASINFGSQSAFANSLSKYFPRIFELMADAALNPNFTQVEFDKEKAKLLTNLKSQEKDVSAISNRVQSSLAYGKDHPYGEFVTEQSVINVTLEDVKQFYTDYFVPANAYLVIIGDVNFKDTKELVETHFTPWTKAVPPSFQFSRPSNALYTQINFVDVPNAVQSEVAVENLVNLKMADDDYLSALMANRILGGGAQGRLFQNLREDKAYTYGAYSGMGNDKYAPASFSASASVRNAVTDSTIVEILGEIDKIIKEPVSEEELKNAKATYIGNFVLALERPETMARYAINMETENLPKDFYKTYLERINAITIEDVQRAAEKYFTVANARVVVTGKGSDVLENLENITFNDKPLQVKYFDKFANPVAKPNYETALPEGVNVNTVLNKYIETIGGKEKLESVASLAMMAEGEMQGMKLNLELKKTSKDQFMQDIKVMGNSMTKQVLNGNQGYIIMQGQRKEMSDEEIKKVKDESMLFPELRYLDSDVSLESIEDIDGKKAYKIKVSEEKYMFYEVETGLLAQVVTSTEMGGQTMTSTISYSDYQEISGIQFPFTISQTMGPQKLDFAVKEMKVNKGISDTDFE